jgi:hypothetical protein
MRSSRSLDFQTVTNSRILKHDARDEIHGFLRRRREMTVLGSVAHLQQICRNYDRRRLVSRYRSGSCISAFAVASVPPS